LKERWGFSSLGLTGKQGRARGGCGGNKMKGGDLLWHTEKGRKGIPGIGVQIVQNGPNQATSKLVMSRRQVSFVSNAKQRIKRGRSNWRSV